MSRFYSMLCKDEIASLYYGINSDKAKESEKPEIAKMTEVGGANGFKEWQEGASPNDVL